MKQTFSNSYFNWILIAIILLFLIDSVPNLFSPFQYFSSYLFRITFSLITMVALISLLAKKGNGERYSRFFIIVGLIIPTLLLYNQFLTDLIFYGVRRTSLLQNPILHLKLIIGIVLYALTLKYSEQTKSDRIQDYGILTSCIGIFLILLIIIRTIEPNFIPGLDTIPIWEVISKTSFGLLIIYLGLRLKSKNMKLKTCLILALISMLIYGLL